MSAITRFLMMLLLTIIDSGNSPAFAADSIPLPGTVSGRFTGASGRFLFYPIPDLEVVAVVDTHAERVVRYLSVPLKDPIFAAGESHFIAAEAATGRVQAWSLTSFERIVDQRLSGVPLPLGSMALGMSSRGPIVVAPASGTFQLPEGLRALTLPPDGKGPIQVSPLPPVRFAIAANYKPGRPIVSTADGSAILLPGTGLLKLVSGAEWFGIGYPGRGDAESEVRLGPTGDFAYGAGGQRAAIEKLFRPQRVPLRRVRNWLSRGVAPTLSPNIYVEWEVDKKSDMSVRLVPATIPPFSDSRRLAVASIPQASGCLLEYIAAREKVFVPSRIRDAIRVAKMQPEGGAFLNIVSAVPGTVRAGERLSHKFEVRGTSGKPTFRLMGGPKGMELTPDGRLSWLVPKEESDVVEATVVLDSDDGQSLRHRLRIRVVPGDTTFLAKYVRGTRLIPLDGRVASSCLGGGDRYLFLWMPADGVITVFDTQKMAIADRLSLDAKGDVLLAAGAKHLVAVKRGSREVTRWSLETFEAGTDQLPAPAHAMTMGTMDTRWLWAMSAEDKPTISACNIENLSVRLQAPTPPGAQSTLYGIQASADGEVVFAHGRQPLRLRHTGEKIAVDRLSGAVGSQIRPIDATTFAGTNGLLRVGIPERVQQTPAQGLSFAATGSQFLRVVEATENGKSILRVELADAFRSNTTPLPGLVMPPRLLTSTRVPAPGTLPPHERLWLVPPADTILELTTSLDALRVHSLNELAGNVLAQNAPAVREDPGAAPKPAPGKALRLAATTDAIRMKSGAVCNYLIRVNGDRGAGKFGLVSGPEGLTVDASGRVSWETPRRESIGLEVAEEFEVVVTLKVGETTQRFRLRITVVFD